jgi:hypothetical protein
VKNLCQTQSNMSVEAYTAKNLHPPQSSSSNKPW